MKKLCSLLFLVSFCIINAQESQEVTASKWKDGIYEYYYPKNYGSLTKWGLFKIKHKLVITRNAKKKVSKISLTGDPSIGTYVNLDSLATEFVRYYTSTSSSDTKLYFNENSIIAYRLKQVSPKPEIEFNYCIGKMANDSIKEEIIAYLEKTMSYYIPSSVSKSNEIEKITAVIISDMDELSSGTYIDLGLVFKMKWGVEVKSKNLGGTIDIKNFVISSSQLEKDKTKNLWKIDCSKTANKEIEVEAWLSYYPETKFKTLIPVKCDTENSPVRMLSKAFNEYDEIRYGSWSNGKQEIKTLKKLPETGYATYPLDLIEIYRKKKIETDLIRVKKDDKIGYTDKNGKIIVPIEYESGTIGNFAYGSIAVKKGGKWGYVTLKNTVAIPFDYDLAWPFKGNIAQIKTNEKFGFINQQGKLIAKAIYDEVWDLSNGVVLVKKDGKYGYINEAGVVISNTIYDDAFDFSDKGFGVVVLNGKRGCVDKTGKIIVAPEFEKNPVQLSPDLFAVYKDGKYGVIKTDGKMLFDFKYDEIYPTGYEYRTNAQKELSNVMRVKLNYKYGYIKTDGKVLSECVFTKASDVGTVGFTMVELYENKVTKGGYFDIKTGKVSWNSEVKDPEEIVSNTSSYSSGGGKSSGGSDKKTLKNTGKNPLYYRTSRGGAASHLNGGSSTTVPCNKDIYYCNDDGKGNHTVTGQLISAANQDCGITVTAQGGN